MGISGILKFIAEPMNVILTATIGVSILLCSLIIILNLDYLLYMTHNLYQKIQTPLNKSLNFLKETPLYLITIFGYVFPTLGQIWGSFSLYSFLVNINQKLVRLTPYTSDEVEEDDLFLPSILPSLIIWIGYGVLWLFSRGKKVPTQQTNLLMQTSWVLQSMFSAKGRALVMKYAFSSALPSLFLSYGSYFIKETPSKTILYAVLIALASSGLVLLSSYALNKEENKKTSKTEENKTLKEFSKSSVYSVSKIDIQKAKQETLEALNNVGLFIKPSNFSPPPEVSVFLSSFKEMPTTMAQTVVLFETLKNLSSKKKVAIGLFSLVLKSPLVLKETLSVRKYLKETKNKVKDSDGLKILLVDSPKAQELWRIISTTEENLEKHEEQDIVTATVKALRTDNKTLKEIFWPNETQISQTKLLSSSIVWLLVFSIIIDLIGVSSFGFPILGELLDIIWAPISAMLVKTMYKSNMLAIVNFLEELLPFMDFIPTATFGWFYTYFDDIPIWSIRLYRSVKFTFTVV